ncbi:trypsin-like peptidase domain-containing protein [Mesorhizobium sp. B2-5-9]|uniref:S1C family serine protease n=1 Tax=unclassified Mesorhizobium TaxID=325217 RepID=UPI00112CC35D|nr:MULTISPECIES: serine protease [unclassified Mesorhizobium]TPK02854.1 trypsin-like peptidase domain-containing protein [Mesorhizobium sp. B2-5-9]TPK82535.1 trypsin-like peptidase domain-containing protein [Mesorhizobium sp. B2-4-13]
MSLKRWAMCSAAVAATIVVFARQPAIADQSDVSSSGTGFFVNDQGWAVTNAHVVEGCTSISVQQLGDGSDLAVDRQNDLAVFRLSMGTGKPHLPLRHSQPRLGEDIAAYGFPLSGLLSDSIKVTTGNINSLVGMENDTRYLQVSTPLQPGNSGGPIVDQWGSIIGVSTAALGSKFTNETGIAVQNVNFAIRSNVVELFLQSRNIQFDAPDPAADAKPLSTADLSDKVVPSVVQVLCHGGEKPVANSGPSPTTAETAPARSGTSSDESVKEAAVAIVRGLIERDSGDAWSSLQAVANVYADFVSYYGKQRTLSEVLADKRDYFTRWPERAYHIRDGSLMVTCANGACMVSGVYDWVVRSIPRNKQARGAARFSYAISLGASPKVISEAGNVLKQ